MELGREIRKLFVPREGCVLVDADYSQIELRDVYKRQLVVLGLMTVLVFVGGIMLFVLGAASLFEHFAMGLMFIGLGIAAEGLSLIHI